MKFLVFFAAFLALATASYIKYHEDFKTADKEFLVKQEKVFNLYNHFLQNYNEDIINVAKEYSIEKHADSYTNAAAYKEFMKFYKHGYLLRYRIFSLTVETQREEAVALFNLFYYAKDFETFYKTACWAREHMNQGLFVYSFTVAVLHRKDCRGIVLPAPYEIYPSYFVSADVYAKAQFANQQGFVSEVKAAEYNGVHYADKTFTFYDNYTNCYDAYDEEQKVSYFTKDVGLNAYYFYFHADYPFWMGGEQYGLNKDRRGELYYYVHQQLLARYYLERLSNGLGEIEHFDWEKPINSQFNPSMVYPNGIPYPQRPEGYHMSADYLQEHIQEVENFEARIRSAVAKGYITTADKTQLSLVDQKGIEILGNFVQSNPDMGNIRHYEYLSLLAKMLLGGASKPVDANHYVPSALENYSTAMQDPVFYQMYKRFLKYFFIYKEHLPSYTKEELYFPGVKVESVKFSPLKTYFENFTFDISNAVYMNKEEMTQKKLENKFEVSQTRLNHQKFEVEYDIHSDKECEAFVRVFIGPKYNHLGHIIDLDENKYNFVEVDYFPYHLKSGKNTFTRDHTEFGRTVYDRTPARTLFKKVTSAMSGDSKFQLDMTEAHNGWPLRLLLPKGRRDGMVYQYYVIVSPFHASKVAYGSTFPYQYSAGVGSGSRYYEDRPFGFPFDREIEETYFHAPNMYFGDMTIYHSDSYSKKNDVTHV